MIVRAKQQIHRYNFLYNINWDEVNDQYDKKHIKKIFS